MLLTVPLLDQLLYSQYTARHMDSMWHQTHLPSEVQVTSLPVSLAHKLVRLFHNGRMGEERGAYRVLVGKPEGKRPLGRPRRRWVNNIRMDLQEVGCGYVDWIGLAHDRDRWRTLVSAVMNLRVP